MAELVRLLSRGSEEAAIARLRARAATLHLGDLPTVAEAVERYLAHLESSAARPNTVAQRRYALWRIAASGDGDSTLGEMGIDRLETATLREAIESVSKNPHTREGIRGAWSALYAWALEQEEALARAGRRDARIARNPARGIPPWRGRPRPETASVAQVEALLGAANVYQEAYVRALVQLGLRQGELRHTRLHLDLDLETWSWRIRPRGAGGPCPCRACRSGGWKPKTRRSTREILVPGERKIRRAILAYLESYPAGEGDLAFRHPDGTAWRSKSLASDFEGLCVAAGVRYGRDADGGITLHTLRHTCATNLIRSGVDSSVVAAILGDRVETVVSAYLHLAPEDLAAGVARGPAW